MKRYTWMIVAVLCASLLAGCMGTPVIYNNCTCPTGGTAGSTGSLPAPSSNELMVGLAIATDISGSKEGQKADFGVTIVAVALDADGIIRQCLIDGIATNAAIAEGVFASDTTDVQTKNELGDQYGMVAWGGAKAEWNKQAEAFASYVIGKTVTQVKGIAVDAGTKPTDADLSASVTIAIGGFQALVEKAAANAKAMGSHVDDTLKLGITASLSCTNADSGVQKSTAQLDVNVAAMTMNGDTITGCVIDAVQAKVEMENGKFTTDITKPVATKNELGDQYGMVAWGGAKAEWNKQAEAFAAYVIGKTVEQVKGIAVDEGTKPTDADLSASVTIAIGGFQALIEKAAK